MINKIYPVYLTSYLVGSLTAKINNKSLKPLFIIGTGRCGTSLLVRILKSNSGFTGFPQEANELWHPKLYPFKNRKVESPPIISDPREFTRISLLGWNSQHRKKISRIFHGYHLLTGKNKQLFIKSAMVSFLIPEIISIFPNAKFIHIYRNGPSVVSSLFKKEWQKYEKYFSSKEDLMKKCANYWNECILEIEKQKKDLSLVEKNSFFELSYEDLCNEPQKITNEIINFLSLSEFKDMFKFNFATIASQNYKVGNYKNDPAWIPLLEIMSDGLKLKEYE